MRRKLFTGIYVMMVMRAVDLMVFLGIKIRKIQKNCFEKSCLHCS